MSMYGVTSSDLQSNHAVSRLSVLHADLSRTNMFADNKDILSIVVQVIAGLHRLGYLVFTCFLVPARPVSVIFLQKESVAGSSYFSTTVLN